jgi:hypothetical protein
LVRRFRELRHLLASAEPVIKRPTLKVDWSVGKGGKSKVPWIAFLDSRETASTRSGVYCVYLFRQDLSGIYLTLNQGATNSEKQFYSVSKASHSALRKNAEQLRSYGRDLEGCNFSLDGAVDLRTDSALGLGYEAGTVAHKFYPEGAIPEDRVLLDDLDAALGAYDQYLKAKPTGPRPQLEEAADQSPDAEAQVSIPTAPTVRRRKGARQLSMEWLEEQTLWTRQELEQLCEAIRTDSHQLLLAGPPGTSKTWVAKHVAEYLAQEKHQVFRTVQFHPSYSYEEFVEGLRPVATEEGAITFRPVPGVLLRFVSEVGEHEGPHILLIDEINRANLPKVLGELMFLFEYRGETIDLQYRQGFSLPKSVRFLGTMNTADRSIRSMDTALRRRFDIVECPPRRDILERYFRHGGNEVVGLLDGFEKLNQLLTELLDRHHTIGHSFFMRRPMTAARLEQIWRHKIAPLIEEYFFDQPDLSEKFSIELLWPGT